MSRITACPRCAERLRVSEQITDKTLICPHCLADVDNPQPGFRIRAADINTEVKRDLSVGSIVLLVLIGLCVLGIAIAFFSIRAGNRGKSPSEGLWQLLIGSFLALDFFVTIAIIRWAISGGGVPSAGRLFGTAFLVLVTAVAIFIFFFFTCLSIGKF